MATDSTLPSLCFSKERTNGFKLISLIIVHGTKALRNVFRTKHPGDLERVLDNYFSKLHFLHTKNIIKPFQWVKLYPPSGRAPDIYDFDITLLFLLLRNICRISAPKTGWDDMPSDKDISLGANIVRIKEFRNEYVGHISDVSVSVAKFKDRWEEVSRTLINLGIRQVEIDQLKDEECGQEKLDRFIKECRENFTKVEAQLLSLTKMQTEDQEPLLDKRSNNKSDEQRSDDILNKHLYSCDFRSLIDQFYQKWCKDTREWVFKQVTEWLNDTKSENRAFIITGQAGMGKSVIAAVICKRYAEQLAACHFCQYNNDRYNDPKTLLQSLARLLSNVLPEYKKALIEKLSGKEGRRLDDMNIKGLFSMLFKEPLTGIDVAEKRYLIVIDAVDESEREGKSDFVDVIADYLGQLPSFIRFLITTRPENQISKNFEKLNPVFLSPNDVENVKDIERLFEKKLSQTKAKDLSSLIDKCEGVMLFAYYLLEIIDDCSPKLDIDNLPTGIEGIYTSYFKRWEKEFQNADVREKEFLSFLGIMAVAKEPLPETLVAKVFDSENNPLAIAKRKMNKIKNCLSLFLVVQQGRLTFFHKSVKDWLVECDHEFQVDEKFGHETLANICSREIDELKKKEIKPPLHSAAEYALLYGIQHKLAETLGEPMKSFIEWYVTDLEIIYASISVDVYATLHNVRSLNEDDIYSSMSEEARRTVKTLTSLIRKYSNTLSDFPQSFLQHVLNWGGEELSSKAASLLNDRYKDLAYFEVIEKDGLENSLVGRISTSRVINGLAISPKEDYLVCCHDDVEIELFSTRDCKPLWKIQSFDLISLSDTKFNFFSMIAFHPLKNVILPSRLDRVINMQGKIELGPFSCDDINHRFVNCCFSNDKSKMATTYGKDLTVWSLVTSKSLNSFSSDHVLLSVSFSANGRLLATSEDGRGVVVYDLERDKISASKTFPVTIYFVSTFKLDSWYCTDNFGPAHQSNLYTVRHDLTALDRVDGGFNGRPLNLRAAAVFSGEDAWFRIFSEEVAGFFCLNHDIALFWKKWSSELDFHRISKLKELQSVRNCHDIPPNARNAISLDGKLIYRAGHDDLRLYKVDSNCSIHLSGNVKLRHLTPFVPVTNGVFICGKLGDSRDCVASCMFQIDIPELWNSDLTLHLGSFFQLSGAEECFSVSEEIVACVKTGQVCFFNVVERKIVSKTHVPHDKKVVACSSRYHVLLSDSKSPYLFQEGEVVAKLAGPKWEYGSLQDSIFSPSSEKLALNFSDHNAVFIFDVTEVKLRHKVDFQFFRTFINRKNILQFLDEDHLLCLASESSVCIISASSGDALSCVNIDDGPTSFCVSRKPVNSSVLLCFMTQNEKIKLIKVCLPR